MTNQKLLKHWLYREIRCFCPGLWGTIDLLSLQHEIRSLLLGCIEIGKMHPTITTIELRRTWH